MSLAIKYGIRDNNLTIKKNIVGSIAIVFKNRKSIVISEDGEVNLSKMCTMEELNQSNLEKLLAKGFIKIIFYK
jgi:hypothetical protein